MHIATSLEERRAELDKQGIIFHNIDFARSINPLAALKSLKQLTKLMKKNNFFLVHVHAPMASLLGR